MRRSAVIVVIVLAAIGTAVAATGALHRAASNLLGTKLGFYDAVFVMGRDGAGLRQLTHDQRFHEYAWSPDGRWIAAVTRSVDAHGIDVQGPLELVELSATTVQDVWLGGFGSDVVWRSNGSIKLLVTRTVSDLDTRLLDISPSRGVRRGASIGPIGAAAWTPHGGALAIVPCARARAPLSIDVLSASGRKRRHLGQLPGALGAGVCDDLLAAADEDLEWAPDGRSLFVNVSTGLWRLSLEGAAPRRVNGDFPPLSAPAVSPDGRQILAEASPSGARAGNPCCLLYVLPAAGGHARLLTPNAARQPAWSPDGRLIAFVGGAGDTINTIRRDGSATTTLAQFPGTQISSLSWSPTGQQLAFTASAKPPED